MINDLLTSSKGPGFIGLILALAVLMGFGSLAFLVFEDKSGGTGISGQIKDKERHLGKLKSREEKWLAAIDDYSEKRKIAAELSNTESLLKRKQALIDAGKAEVAGMEAKVAQTEKKVEDYKDRYRIYERGRAVGEKMDFLTIKNGKKYEQVVIRRVFNEGMDIRHKNGGTLVKYQLLPDDLLDRFQFSAKDEKAVKNLKKLRQQRAALGEKAYAKSVKAIALRNKISAHKYTISVLAKQIAKAESSIVSKNAAAERSRLKAQKHRASYSNARAAGRSSMLGALAKKEDEKAANYLDAARKLGAYVVGKQGEVAKMNIAISNLKNDLKVLESSKK